ncbi:AMP-binding protein [Streptosporangium roseum]|uniref:AMP-binding protein n=1 Tax=Streptosporangium roseum TaxID=2001 RepID=UPI00331CD9D5
MAWRSHLDVAGFDGDDNFFELGGDSLAALKIVNQFTDTGLSFSLSDFYDHPTINEQLALLSSAVPAEAAESLPPAGERRLPLTPIQPVLVLDSLRRPDSTAYWMISAHRFTAPVSVAAAQQAWEAMVARNPALRTRILRDSSGLSQVIDVDSSGAELRCVESLSLAGMSLADWSAEKTSRLLDGGMDTLVAGWFIASCDERAGAEPAPVLVFAAHHALLDGWSLAQCLEDFVEALADPPSQPVVPRLSVAAYFDWRDQNGAEEASFEYWRRRLAGQRPAQTLDFARTATDEADSAVIDARAHVSELSASDSAAVAAYCTGQGVTQAAFLAHVWGRVLARYQEDADICVGLTVNIRPATLPGSIRLSGCLINVVPLVCPETGGEVVEGARLMMNAIAAATEHGHVTHPRICEAAGLPPSTRLFASTLVFQNFDGDLGTLGAGAPVARLVHSSGGTSDPLSLTVSLGERIRLLAEWDDSRYDGKVVESLLEAVAYFAVHPEALRTSLTPAEQAGAILGTAAQARPWRIGDYLRMADGDAIAVADEGDSCTYAELLDRSRAMADYLSRRLGLRPGSRVAFIGRRGVDAAVAICGAWRAGIAWSAVDSGLPPRRQRQLLDALRPNQCVVLDQDAWRELSEAPDDFDETLPADSPAYLVATSGSTGTPKVVVLAAGGLAPLVEAWQEAYIPGPGGHSVLQLGSWTADVFLGDLLKALCTGGRLVVCPDERRVDMAHLEALICEHRITLMESTPALVSALLRHIDRSTKRGRLSLRTFIVGSDIFRSAELEQMRRLLPPAVRLVNGYGLSECTVESVIYDSARSSGESRSGLCPIGEPLPGTELDIVNGAGHRLPRGALGEVRITGPGVGLGYLTDGRPSIRGGFTSRDGVRSYRTGDFGVIDMEGTIQFFGRRDAQVKIHGHRVELGEIENLLLTHDGVDEVHVRADGDASLRAFVGSSGNLDADLLRDWLGDRLSPYAIPRSIDVMSRLPRTENGKIDRTTLAARPEPELAASSGTGSGTTPLAAEITQIWEQLLSVKVEPDRSFFDSGGHSILVITLFERLRERLAEYEFTIADLFRFPTVNTFARHLRGVPNDRMSILRAVERGELTAREGFQMIGELTR